MKSTEVVLRRPRGQDLLSTPSSTPNLSPPPPSRSLWAGSKEPRYLALLASVIGMALVVFLLASSLFLLAALVAASHPRSLIATPTFTVKVTGTFPHDVDAFTEGLAWDPMDLAGGHLGSLIETTGLYKASTVRRRPLPHPEGSAAEGSRVEGGPEVQRHNALGRLEQLRHLDPTVFAEGATVWKGSIVVLQYKSSRVLLLNRTSLADRTKTPPIVGQAKRRGGARLGDAEDESYDLELPPGVEGWGVTTSADGSVLIVSDGSSTLHMLSNDTPSNDAEGSSGDNSRDNSRDKNKDRSSSTSSSSSSSSGVGGGGGEPATTTQLLRSVGRVRVMDGAWEVPGLNELEMVRGEIFANVAGTDCIVRILPDTGQVVGWIIVQEEGREERSVGGGNQRYHSRYRSLYASNPNPQVNILNGIAFVPPQRDETMHTLGHTGGHTGHTGHTGRLFLTGKRWPHMFEVELVRHQSWASSGVSRGVAGERGKRGDRGDIRNRGDRGGSSGGERQGGEEGEYGSPREYCLRGSLMGQDDAQWVVRETMNELLGRGGGGARGGQKRDESGERETRRRDGGDDEDDSGGGGGGGDDADEEDEDGGAMLGGTAAHREPSSTPQLKSVAAPVRRERERVAGGGMTQARFAKPPAG